MPKRRTDDSCRCWLNRTSSKRWENAAVPAPGSMVLVSGYLDGENAAALRVDVRVVRPAYLWDTRGIV